MWILIFLLGLLVLSLISTYPVLVLYLAPIGFLVYLIRSARKKAAQKARLEMERQLSIRRIELAEQERLAAIERKKLWDIEVDKQQKMRIERVNRRRENYRIVSEVCGVCGSTLNSNSICVSGCKPLEE